MMKNYDVIICGAGIAGLLLGSYLSNTFKVLVVESNEKFSLNKFWVTAAQCKEDNPQLSHCVDSYFFKMEFSDYTRTRYYLTGNYVLWDTEKLISHFKDTIERNNGRIQFSQKFCGYKTYNDHIQVFINDSELKAKLLIDCMGYRSPLIQSKDLIRIKGYYMIYGTKLKITNSFTPICLSNTILDKQPKYFEVFPTSNGDAFAVLMLPSHLLQNANCLKSDFKFMVKNSMYAKYFNGEILESGLQGIVPVGTVNKKALDRIFFFGESAQSNPAVTNTCLTRLLLSHKKIVEFLSKRIQDDNLSKHSLQKAPVVLDDFNRKLQIHVFKEVLSCNSDKFAQFINVINNLDHELINKFIFGELTKNELLSYNTFKQMSKKSNHVLINSILNSMLSFK